ncbi:MAG: PqqD family protein [Sphingomonas sp.]|jgi:hypothetical protein|uniref:PqqD family protein n=1 Tax=Sphingomonas sp. TaxID=28214 RepID=UPI0035685CE7
MQDSDLDHRLITGSIRSGRDVLSTEIDGEVFLMSIDNGRYYALDAVATAIWRRLDSGPTGEALIAGLIADFQGNPGCIRADVLALLGYWFEEGLVSVDA